MVAHHILGHGERDGVAFHGAAAGNARADGDLRRIVVVEDGAGGISGADIVTAPLSLVALTIWAVKVSTAFLQLVHIGGDIECLGQRIGIDDDVDRVDQLVVCAFGGRVTARHCISLPSRWWHGRSSHPGTR